MGKSYEILFEIHTLQKTHIFIQNSPCFPTNSHDSNSGPSTQNFNIKQGSKSTISSKEFSIQPKHISTPSFTITHIHNQAIVSIHIWLNALQGSDSQFKHKIFIQLVQFQEHQLIIQNHNMHSTRPTSISYPSYKSQQEFYISTHAVPFPYSPNSPKFNHQGWGSMELP